MVLYDPERRWAARAVCRPEDMHLFFADGGGPGRTSRKVQRAWSQAKEICAMCPVLLECRRDTGGEDYGVWGGVDQVERELLRRRLPKAARRWPPERRLAWGEAVYALRRAAVSWRDITLQTGLPHNVAEELAALWREHLRSEQPRPAVVDLTLPEERTRGPAFPVKPGRRHAWVRHRGIVSDAIYRGETPSGEWVFVTVYAGHGNANKWVLRRDVQIYHPQPVIIMSKRREAQDDPAPECEQAA